MTETTQAGPETDTTAAATETQSSGDANSESSSVGSSSTAPPQPSERVKAMQEELTQAGFYEGPIDGLYGSATASAIRAAQESAGLTVDGVYGPQTHEALVAKIAGTDANAQESHDSPHMRLVQQDLTYLGYFQGEIDGQFGPQTEAAVKAFQTDQGLPVTGQIDAETDAALTTAMENFAN